MILVLLASWTLTAAPISITVYADSGRQPISPFLYGKNNGLDSASLRKSNEAGLRMLRANGGNNATKYNWQNGLSCHPDWYNNVYSDNWDVTARTIQDSLPGIQGLFAFQLLGWVADNAKNNFGDWNWAQTWAAKIHTDTLWKNHGWTDFGAANQDLAGGGVPDTVIHVTQNTWGPSYDMGKALVKGDPAKYLKLWPADSTAGILDHWFGVGGIGLNPELYRYWNMDNEPDIWSGTHNDIQSDTMSFETYFQKYLAVAKAVRTRNPRVKLVGPVFANEWQWWTWNNKAINDGGVDRSPMEMFLKRIGQEEKLSGQKLLDVFDLHFYPGYNNLSDVPNMLQMHRMLFDTSYAWPGANGFHFYDGKWGKAVPYYVLGRVQKWMTQYLAEWRPFSMTEFGSMSAGGDVDVRNLAYASLLGTFADHGGEILTAWDWYPGMWEVLHLFSRSAHGTRVASSSSVDTLVSAYSSLSDAGDSLTVILVNRNPSTAQAVSVTLSGFIPSGDATTLQLSGLKSETFVSGSQNALKHGAVAVVSGSLSLSIPSKSITAIQLVGKGRPVVGRVRKPNGPEAASFSQTGSTLRLSASAGARFDLVSMQGRLLGSTEIKSGSATLSTKGLVRGVYLAKWAEGSKKVVVGN